MCPKPPSMWSRIAFDLPRFLILGISVTKELYPKWMKCRVIKIQFKGFEKSFQWKKFLICQNGQIKFSRRVYQRFCKGMLKNSSYIVCTSTFTVHIIYNFHLNGSFWNLDLQKVKDISRIIDCDSCFNS